jgi:transposase
MASPLVPDELWEVVEPLIPKVERRYRYPGRKRVPDRRTLTGILFVLKTGIAWEDLPQEIGCGSGVTCWRRLRDWQEQGVWQRLHEALLARLNAAGEIDWQRAAVDSSHVRAFGGGERTGPSPVDRRKPGSKHHLITCGHGNPLAAETTRRQRQRHHPLRVIGGRRAGDPWPARAAEAKAEERLRRSGLSFTEVTARTAPPQNQSQGRQAKRSARLRPRPQALGGRAHNLLASPVPPPACSL